MPLELTVSLPAGGTVTARVYEPANPVRDAALILAHGQAWPFYWIGQIALWIVVVTALVSGADYFRRFNAIVSG